MMATDLLNGILVTLIVTIASTLFCPILCWSLASRSPLQKTMRLFSQQAQLRLLQIWFTQSCDSTPMVQPPKTMVVEQPIRGFGLRKKLENNRERLGIGTYS
jgi:hypothetical protein